MAVLMPIATFIQIDRTRIDPRRDPRARGDDSLSARSPDHAARLNVTPQRSNPSPDTLQPLAFAASRTFATSETLNVSPVIRSTSPFTKRKLQFGSFSSDSPPAFLLAGTPIGDNGIVAVAWCVAIGAAGYLWARRLYERVPARPGV